MVGSGLDWPAFWAFSPGLAWAARRLLALLRCPFALASSWLPAFAVQVLTAPAPPPAPPQVGCVVCVCFLLAASALVPFLAFLLVVPPLSSLFPLSLAPRMLSCAFRFPLLLALWLSCLVRCPLFLPLLLPHVPRACPSVRCCTVPRSRLRGFSSSVLFSAFVRCFSLDPRESSRCILPPYGPLPSHARSPPLPFRLWLPLLPVVASCFHLASPASSICTVGPCSVNALIPRPCIFPWPRAPASFPRVSLCACYGFLCYGQALSVYLLPPRSPFSFLIRSLGRHSGLPLLCCNVGFFVPWVSVSFLALPFSPVFVPLCAASWLRPPHLAFPRPAGVWAYGSPAPPPLGLPCLPRCGPPPSALCASSFSLSYSVLLGVFSALWFYSVYGVAAYVCLRYPVASSLPSLLLCGSRSCFPFR